MLYTNELKSWIFGCANAPGFDDRGSFRMAQNQLLSSFVYNLISCV